MADDIWVLKDGYTHTYLNLNGNIVEWPRESGYADSKCDDNAFKLTTSAAFIALVTSTLAF